MNNDSKLWPAIEYAYDFSRVYYYYAGYFCYAKFDKQPQHMGPIQAMLS